MPCQHGHLRSRRFYLDCSGIPTCPCHLCTVAPCSQRCLVRGYLALRRFHRRARGLRVAAKNCVLCLSELMGGIFTDNPDPNATRGRNVVEALKIISPCNEP